jgi:hypothetical protein
MKNPAPRLRKRIYALLHNNVVYGGETILVREGEGEITKNQIIIGGYSDTGEAVKGCIVKRAAQDVEIVTIKDDAASKDSDAITELVLNLLSPTAESDLLSDADFEVMLTAAPSLLPIRETSVEGKRVVRRVIRYNLLLDQK